jgi:WD40 repeat protein
MGIIENEMFSTSEIAQIGLQAKPSAIAFDPCQSLLAIGLNNGSCLLVGDAFEITLTPPLGCQAAQISYLGFRERYLFAIMDRQAVVWDLVKIELSTFTTMTGMISTVCMCPKSTWIFLSVNGNSHLLDIASGELSEYIVTSHSSTGQAVVVSIKPNPVDEKSFLVVYNDGLAVLFDAELKKATMQFEFVAPAQCFDSAWNPEGNCFVVGYLDGTLVFWNNKKKKFDLTLKKKTTITKYESKMNFFQQIGGDSASLSRMEWETINSLPTIVVAGEHGVQFLPTNNGLKIENAYRVGSKGVVDFVLAPECEDQNEAVLYITQKGQVCCNLLDESLDPLIVPGSVSFETMHEKNVSMSAGSQEIIDAMRKHYNIPTFTLNGGHTTRNNSRKMYDILFAFEKDTVDFYHANVPTPDLISQLTVHDGITHDIKSVVMAEADKALIVTGESQVLLYLLEDVKQSNYRKLKEKRQKRISMISWPS